MRLWLKVRHQGYLGFLWILIFQGIIGHFWLFLILPLYLTWEMIYLALLGVIIFSSASRVCLYIGHFWLFLILPLYFIWKIIYPALLGVIIFSTTSHVWLYSYFYILTYCINTTDLCLFNIQLSPHCFDLLNEKKRTRHSKHTTPNTTYLIIAYQEVPSWFKSMLLTLFLAKIVTVAA